MTPTTAAEWATFCNHFGPLAGIGGPVALLCVDCANAYASQQVEAALERVEKSLNAASEERYQDLKKWEAESSKWQAEGDMYGWNFFQGMAAGANWCDILYRRIDQELAAIRALPLEP